MSREDIPCNLNALEATHRVSRLALGTVQFGLPYGIANQSGQVARPEARAMLQLAATKGIDLLDTAIAYGASETCLGEVGIQGFKLVTKLPALPDGCPSASDWVKEQVSASLARLGVSAVYGLLLHRPQQLLGTGGQELYQALQELKESGRAQKVGVSIYDPSELEVIAKSFRLDLVQAPFNLVDRRLHSTGWLQRLKGLGTEVHTRSVFLQGLLLMPTPPTKFASWNYLWHRWQKWLKENQLNAVEACLAFPLAFPEIDRVIVGLDSVNQLTEIIGAANSALQLDWPDLQCEEENLINPSRWPQL
jgi:aryl-alcohol dehydrogenase-like predicted oxidoreductase